MAAKKPKYDPNGKYRALKLIRHPESPHADGRIDPERDADLTFSMAHRADEPQAIVRLVEELKAIEPVPDKKK